jgi:hypothetical protein
MHSPATGRLTGNFLEGHLAGYVCYLRDGSVQVVVIEWRRRKTLVIETGIMVRDSDSADASVGL